MSQLASPQWSAKRVAQTAAQLGAKVLVAHPGHVMTAGTAKLELWGGVQLSDAGTDEPGEESTVENNSSVVLKATVNGLTVVLPGDAEPEEQRHILAGRMDLSSDVLVLPHHGSAHQDEDFWAATGASVAVASAGQGNPCLLYTSPSPRDRQKSRMPSSA